jgi:hypothetical protein
LAGFNDWGFRISDFGFIKRIYLLFYREKSAMRWKAEGLRYRVSRIRKLECGMRKIRKGGK